MTHTGRQPYGGNGPNGGNGGNGGSQPRRIQETVTFAGLTIAEGEWLAEMTPDFIGAARAAQDAITVRDVALRYRPGRLGIADALDATEEIFRPFARAGAVIESRHHWEIIDDDDGDGDGPGMVIHGSPRSFAEAMRLHQLHARRLPDDVDLSVDATLVVDAAADDRVAALIFWLALCLPSHDW